MEGKSRSDSFALASSHFLGDFAVLPAVGVVFRPRVADRTVGCSFRCPVSCALLLGGGSQWRFERKLATYVSPVSAHPERSVGSVLWPLVSADFSRWLWIVAASLPTSAACRELMAI